MPQSLPSAFGHDLDWHAALKIRRVLLPIVEGHLLAVGQRGHEVLVLRSIHRAVYVVLASLVPSRSHPGYVHVDAVAMNDRSDRIEEGEGAVTSFGGNRFGEPGLGQRARCDDRGMIWKDIDPLAHDIDVRMLLNRPGDVGGKAAPVDGERRTSGYTVLGSGAHNERSKRSHLLVEQPDCVVLGVVRTKAVGADHFGQMAGLMRRGAALAATHFAQLHSKARLGKLPSGFASREAAADNVDVEGHAGAVSRRTTRYPALMFSALLLMAAQSLSANNYGIDEPMPAHSGALLWADEFNEPVLDMSKWSFDTSRNKVGWYNKELEYYSANRPQNLRLENGKLIIELRKDPEAIRKFPDWGKQQYSSAKITTKDKVAFKYGFVEVSAKLPCSRGTWPAIWMMPEGDAPWPEGGEIDILEQVGSQPNVAHATLHTALYNHSRGTGRGAQTRVPTACGAFHRYQLAWTNKAITMGVDDRAYMQVRNDQPGGRGAWPFDTPFYLILNLAMGGDWAAAKGIDDAALPQRIEVDYVRIWEMPPTATSKPN